VVCLNRTSGLGLEERQLQAGSGPSLRACYRQSPIRCGRAGGTILLPRSGRVRYGSSGSLKLST
jgi:hypothetical protein